MERKIPTKSDIRKALILKRNSLTNNQQCDYSNRICNILIEELNLINQDRVFIYAATGSEVSLDRLCGVLREANKIVAFPRAFPDLSMNFYQVDELKELEKGYKGIREPHDNPKNLMVPIQRDIILVPGVGFDKDFNRMGYGKGFYDRYLEKYPACIKIGICYGISVVDRLPCDSTDIKMDMIVTEEGLWKREKDSYII